MVIEQDYGVVKEVTAPEAIVSPYTGNGQHSVQT